MIILDTNVVSALMQGGPDQTAVNWLDRQDRNAVWTTAITVMETLLGLRIMTAGRRLERLRAAFEAILERGLNRRILAFDEDAARETASVMADRRSLGRPIEVRDAMIAGIARSACGAIVTRNVRHFTDVGVALIDPWAATD